MKKGDWSEEEDNKLRAFVLTHGHWNWRLLPKYAGNCVQSIEEKRGKAGKKL
ncbi:hypothetical protein ACS0TY_021493 [Phlomoides rotata]